MEGMAEINTTLKDFQNIELAVPIVSLFIYLKKKFFKFIYFERERVGEG